MKLSKKLVIILSVVAVVLIASFLGYNSLVTVEERVNFQWNEIQNAYQRRSDLIPNLVSIVKGSTDYERTTLRKLTEARANAQQTRPDTVSYEMYQKQEAGQAEVTNNINRVIAVVESYPDLQSTKQFQSLQTDLVGTERRIKFARKDFNQAVLVYNKKVRSFPMNLLAGITGFKPRNGFEADKGTENAPEVKF